MKIEPIYRKRGSVLLVALLTITIMTLICATSLYVASQNANGGVQTASWHQALSGAEDGITQAIDALNTNTWTNWNVVNSSTLPTAQPAGGSAANAKPTGNQYNYLPLTAIGLQGESNNNVTGWVTVDNISNMQQANGGSNYPWYRIRAIGVASPPSGQSWVKRVGNNKLDNDLRKISLNFDRIAGGTISTPQAMRTVELIAQPVFSITAPAGPAWTMKGAVKFSGMEMFDSFNSNSGSYASQATHTYSVSGYPSVPYANSNVQISTQDSTGSNFNSQLLFGNVVYSGPTLKGTGPDSHGYGGVQGTVSTPYGGTISSVTNPSGTFTTIGSPTGTLAAGTQNHPTMYKYNGDFTLNSGQALTFQNTNSGNNNNYVILWVTGNVNLNGQNNIVVQNGVNVKIYGDNDINFNGDSFQNNNVNAFGGPLAGNMTIYGVDSAGKMTISDNAANPNQTFVGIINAPGYYINVKSAFNFYGSVTGASSQTSAAAKYHYDEALGSGGTNGTTTVSNYAYASWFEDNSATGRKDQNGNALITY
jgi:hypothetical protein